jgi:transcriptional regulator with PAS, ATPase and Fis domain
MFPFNPQGGNPVIEALLDAIAEALILVRPTGEIVAVNRTAEELFHWNRSLLIGQRLADLQEIWAPPTLRRCLESGQRQTLIQEVRGRRLVLSATPVAEGHVLGSARDITELDRLQRQVERMTLERERYQHELADLRAHQAGWEEIVATSRPMQKVLALAERVAAVDSTILLLGESGVGKGMLAQSIHRWSPRSGGPFVKVECGALPEALLESELFGYAPGAFTGARKEGKAGILEQANGGTLFMDEIGELSPALQVKLLHVIQERRFTRVGGVAPININVRIVAATHRDLEQMVREGRFREDLFYRLNVVPLTIPPLRERQADLPLLIRHFVDRFCTRHRVERSLAAETLERLLAYRWPGNVRELENMIERLIVTSDGPEIGPELLPASISTSGSPVLVRRVVPLKEALEALEMELIGAAYRELGSSVKVGQALGIHQTSAARKIREWRKRNLE